MEARIINVKNDTEKQKLESQMIVEGYKRKGLDLVLNKKFIWLFFLGFGSIFIIYIFIIFIILYIIYIIYYFMTREKDRVRIVVDPSTTPISADNTINEESIVNFEVNNVPNVQIKEEDPEKKKRKNKFILALGIILTIFIPSIYVITNYGLFWASYNTIFTLLLSLIGLVPVIIGIYGLYVK